MMAYEDFVQLYWRDRCVQRTTDLSKDEIAAVENSQMVPDHEYLNVELAPNATD